MNGGKDVEVHFIDRLPDNAETYKKPLTKWQRIAKALRNKPRKWAVVESKSTETKAKQVVSQIRNGYYADMGERDFDAATSFDGSQWLIYAMYVGKRRSPTADDLAEFSRQAQEEREADIRRHNRLTHSTESSIATTQTAIS